MGRRAVRVFVRTRPTPALASGLSFTESQCVIARSFTCSSLSTPSEGTALSVDGVLHNATQEEVYATTAAPVVDAVLRGGNGAVIAYGPTGAGKSFTMAGQGLSKARTMGLAGGEGAASLKEIVSDNKRGVIPRALRHVFEELERRGGNNREGAVTVSYLEIYNEVMRDLLEPARTQAAVVAAENGNNQDRGAVCVKGLSCKVVQSETEALEWFLKGEAARTTGPHALNTLSSRSHAVFIVSITPQFNGSSKAQSSQLALVDLAGSERTKKSGSGGLALKEAKFINKSLSFLEQTVAALAAAARRRKFTGGMSGSDGHEHIPFRQTKLTEVLRGALSGGGQAAMIACVWPKDAQVEETLCALRFAARVRGLQTDGKVRTFSSGGGNLILNVAAAIIITSTSISIIILPPPRDRQLARTMILICLCVCLHTSR